jgi:hypothetical protein
MSYENRKRLQADELKTAIKVQTKLQEGRINYNNDIIPPPIVEVPREELYKNVDYNEKVLKDNIVKLGLSYAKATEIITHLSVDEIIKANAFWNHLHSEIIKKFDPRALSPLFIVDYIKSEIIKIKNSVIDTISMNAKKTLTNEKNFDKSFVKNTVDGKDVMNSKAATDEIKQLKTYMKAAELKNPLDYDDILNKINDKKAHDFFINGSSSSYLPNLADLVPELNTWEEKQKRLRNTKKGTEIKKSVRDNMTYYENEKNDMINKISMLDKGINDNMTDYENKIKNNIDNLDNVLKNQSAIIDDFVGEFPFESLSEQYQQGIILKIHQKLDKELEIIKNKDLSKMPYVEKLKLDNNFKEFLVNNFNNYIQLIDYINEQNNNQILKENRAASIIAKNIKSTRPTRLEKKLNDSLSGLVSDLTKPLTEFQELKRNQKEMPKKGENKKK